MLLHEKYIKKKETSYPLEPLDCTRHETRFMNLYYPALMGKSRENLDNTGYIRG